MWQSAYSEFYFCEALWPAFRKVDFLRALRDYAGRQRRFGSASSVLPLRRSRSSQDGNKNRRKIIGQSGAGDLRLIPSAGKPPADRGGQYMERIFAPVVWEAASGLQAEPPHQ